jgi:hypothetical protein
VEDGAGEVMALKLCAKRASVCWTCVGPTRATFGTLVAARQREPARRACPDLSPWAAGWSGRLVCLVCVSGKRPLIVAWRLLQGAATEKGKEAAVTKELVQQPVELGGKDCIELLLRDALYADGPLLAWLKYELGIDALVPLPCDRVLYQDLMGLARGGLLRFGRHHCVRTIRGHEHRRELEVAPRGGLAGWDGFAEAAARHSAAGAKLWACMIREVAPEAKPLEEAFALVSTPDWADGFRAYQAFRPRWYAENDSYRELKEGWGLEGQRWGRDVEAACGRVALTCLGVQHTASSSTLAGCAALVREVNRARRRRHQSRGRARIAGEPCHLPREAAAVDVDVPELGLGADAGPVVERDERVAAVAASSLEVAADLVVLAGVALLGDQASVDLGGGVPLLPGRGLILGEDGVNGVAERAEDRGWPRLNDGVGRRLGVLQGFADRCPARRRTASRSDGNSSRPGGPAESWRNRPRYASLSPYGGIITARKGCATGGPGLGAEGGPEFDADHHPPEPPCQDWSQHDGVVVTLPAGRAARQAYPLAARAAGK